MLFFFCKTKTFPVKTLWNKSQTKFHKIDVLDHKLPKKWLFLCELLLVSFFFLILFRTVSKSSSARLNHLNHLTVSNFPQQSPTTRNNMQTDVTCNIQQCWELLANKNVASVCTGLKSTYGPNNIKLLGSLWISTEIVWIFIWSCRKYIHLKSFLFQ